MTKDTNDYDALANWAETEMTLPVRSATAKRDAEAAAAGRNLLRAVGRPSLSIGATPGKTSPKRQVRLPNDISEGVDALAAREGRKAAEVMRAAITEYVQAHAV